jgi:hypothetical protein
MQTIWKYRLSPATRQKFEIPAGFRVLSVQYQRSELSFCLWVLVDDAALAQTVDVRLVATGVDIADVANYTYLDTIQDGDEVLHLFYRNCHSPALRGPTT